MLYIHCLIFAQAFFLPTANFHCLTLIIHDAVMVYGYLSYIFSRNRFLSEMLSSHHGTLGRLPTLFGKKTHSHFQLFTSWEKIESERKWRHWILLKNVFFTRILPCFATARVRNVRVENSEDAHNSPPHPLTSSHRNISCNLYPNWRVRVASSCQLYFFGATAISLSAFLSPLSSSLFAYHMV